MVSIGEKVRYMTDEFRPMEPTEPNHDVRNGVIIVAAIVFVVGACAAVTLWFLIR